MRLIHPRLTAVASASWAEAWLQNEDEIGVLESQGQENLQELSWSKDPSQAWLEFLRTGNPLALVVVARNTPCIVVLR